MLAARAALAFPPVRASDRCSRPAGPAAGDDRNANGVRDGPGDFHVVAVLGAVGVHRGQHDLAGPQPLDLARPGDGFQSGRNPPAVDVDFPHLAAAPCGSAWGRC